MAVLYGPCTITYDSTDIGKTNGGIVLNVLREVQEEPKLSGGMVRREYVSKVVGVIKKYEPEAFSLTDSLLKSSTAATLVFTGDTFTVTVNNAYLEYPENMEFGVNEQRSFDMSFYAYADGSTTLLQVTTS